MSFTTVPFMFVFLPETLLVYGCAVRGSIRVKNRILLVASLLFYGWCGVQYLLLMLVLLAVNYMGAGRIRTAEAAKKGWLCILALTDIAVLCFFKYFNFFAENIEKIVQIWQPQFSFHAPQIPLPLGISFIVFQMISFLADTYRGEADADCFEDYALYMMFFPQLIQGPIVRYHEVALSLKSREISAEKTEYGVRRFIGGAAKKLLIADQLSAVSDEIFGAAAAGIPMGYAWLGAVCYAFVIYFDFSGYSDMAIGLCEIFGFHIAENFNYPYVSKSIQEFWRRWHISLSSWFKDYVYIPLGGNRAGTLKTYRNLIIVFLLTGFWHGASWTFLVWGIYHGTFQLLERLGLKKLLKKLPACFSHIYCMLAVLVGWVFFRADSLGQAGSYIKNMFIPNSVSYRQISILKLLDTRFWFVLLAAVIFSLPAGEAINHRFSAGKARVIGNVLYAALLVISMAVMLGSAFSPSIYTKF